MNSLKISIPQDEIADFCRRHSIRRLSFFGSVLRDDFGPDSDVDVLVEFEMSNREDNESAVRLRHMLDYAREAVSLARGK